MGAVFLQKSIVENLSLACVCVYEDSVLGHELGLALSPELAALHLLTDKIMSIDSSSLGNIFYAPLLLWYETSYLLKSFNCLCNVHMYIYVATQDIYKVKSRVCDYLD